MARYDYGQLQRLWIQNGGDQALAPTMAAVALAESGGDSNATNPTSKAAGLWQIYPPEAGSYDPNTNAQIAVRKERDQGLTAWQAYTNGSFRRFVQPGGTASSAPAQGPCYIGGFTLFGACWCLDGLLGAGAFGLGIGALVLGLAEGERRFTFPLLFGGYALMYFGASLITQKGPPVQGAKKGPGPASLMYDALGIGNPDLAPLQLDCQGSQPGQPPLPYPQTALQPNPQPQPAPQPSPSPAPLPSPDAIRPRPVPVPQPAPVADQLDRLRQQIQAVLEAAARVPFGLGRWMEAELRRILASTRQPGASPSAIQRQIDSILARLRGLPGFQPPRAY